MLSRSPLPEPSAVEPVSVMSGGGRVTVRLAGETGEGVTPRMDRRAAHLLAAMPAAGPAATPGTPAAGGAAAG